MSSGCGMVMSWFNSSPRVESLLDVPVFAIWVQNEDQYVGICVAICLQGPWCKRENKHRVKLIARVSERVERSKYRSCLPLLLHTLPAIVHRPILDKTHVHSCALRSEAVITRDRNRQGQEARPGQRCPVPRGHVPPAPGLNRDVSTANGRRGGGVLVVRLLLGLSPPQDLLYCKNFWTSLCHQLCINKKTVP